jgi:glycosyltransferase involved in cell wall biosynthesis
MAPALQCPPERPLVREVDLSQPSRTDGRLDLTVLVPVLDEADSVALLTDQLRAVLDARGLSWEVVFVDDGSRDGTVQRVREQHLLDDRVKLLRLRRNFGKAAALSAGFDHARGRLVLTIDGDLQDDPNEIPRMLDMLEAEDLDLVSGWKQRRRDPWSKRLSSLLFNWFTRQLARVDLHDFNCGFKLYRREVLEQVAVYGELHRFIPVLASRRGFVIGELPVRHHPRRHGRSKYGWDRAYKGILDLITVLFITRYNRRPLHLFGVFGLLSFGAGFAICAWLAWQWFGGARLADRPLLLLGILLMVLGIQILTSGLIGEMITFKSFQRSDSYSIKEWLE